MIIGHGEVCVYRGTGVPFLSRKLRKAVFINAVFETRHFWFSFCSVFFLRPRPISICKRHLPLRCKVSGTGAPSLLSTTVILTVFKDRTVLRDTARRCNILVAYQLHPAPESAARIDSCETLQNKAFQKIWRFFDGLLAVTWRSQVDCASTAMTVLTVFTSCCARTILKLQTIRPLKGSPLWKTLMGRAPGERNWPTAQTWEQDNARDGKKTKLRWTSTKVACYKGCLWQLLTFKLIAFYRQIRKPFNNVTVIAVTSWNSWGELFSVTAFCIKNKETVAVMQIDSTDPWKL